MVKTVYGFESLTVCSDDIKGYSNNDTGLK